MNSVVKEVLTARTDLYFCIFWRYFMGTTTRV